jgi:hypothetical protein
MAVEIPNLWPVEAIKVDVLSPVAILRAQAGHFQQASMGLLRAEVSTTTGDNRVSHQMDIVAPALGNYRHAILTVRHSADMPYPATVYDAGTGSTGGQTKPTLCISLLPPQPFEAYSEKEFVEKVSSILNSGTVIALIQSLLARSSEATAPPTPEAISES